MEPRTTPPPTDPHAPPDIRLRDPAGAVAAVPYLLGFTPQRSLVVIGIDHDQSVAASLRCDYEPGCSPATTRLLWDHLRRVLLRNGCRTSLLLVYAPQDPDDLATGWVDALLGTVLPRAHEDDESPDHDLDDCRDEDESDEHPDDQGQDRLDVLDVLVVGPNRFRSLLCEDPGCCPPQGTPVSDAGHHPVAAGFVLAGRSPAADRASVAPEGVATEAERARATAAARAATPTPRSVGIGVEVADDLLDRWVGSLPEGPPPELAGTLAAAWRASPGLRDACLAALLPGGPTRRLQQVLADPGCARATRVGSPVLRRMAALTSGHERATVLAAHAWLCWVAGEGTAAGVLAERALRTGGDQPLARLVLQCLGHGLGAPWTSARRGTSAGRPPRGWP